MSPVIGLTALGHALRRLGAKADVGAAVEAALAALDKNRLGLRTPASALCCADIFWLVGFLVAGGLYYLLTPRGATPSATAGQPAAEVGAG